MTSTELDLMLRGECKLPLPARVPTMPTEQELDVCEARLRETELRKCETVRAKRSK